MVEQDDGPERKPRYAGPRHVVELPLSVTEADRHKLERRFAAKNTLRNGILQFALVALDACRADPAWAAARKLPRETKKKRKVRSEAFRAVRERHGLDETSLCAAERAMREACWIGDHVTARLGEVIVKDVLKAIDGHLFKRKGRPRFRKAADCRTISARQASPMLLKGDIASGLFLSWSGLELRVRRKEFSPSELHSLGCRIIHCRVKRVPSGRVEPASPWRYALQVVVAGEPLAHRERASDGVIGVDMGPAMAGAVWHGGAAGAGHELIPLAAEVESDEAAIRRSGRMLDRQRRAANPDCFDKAGRWIKGRRIRHQSERHRREMASRRRRDAKAATHRKNCHGRDTNRILGVANEIRIEDHGYVGWTALWGRQMGRGAPGLFVSELKRKCLDAGGTIVEINTCRAALSQVDACGGERLKKPLRQRWHELGPQAPVPGFVQRDLHSALLASHCDAEGAIDHAGVIGTLSGLSSQSPGAREDGPAARMSRKGPCQGLVRPSARECERMAEAARAGASRPPRSKDRRSGSNGSREVPVTRGPISRRQRRLEWIRGRIATRRTRKGKVPKGSSPTGLCDLACG